MCPPLEGVPGRRGRNSNKQMEIATNNHYNKNLQPFANQNRKQLTKGEACLWKYALKAKQMGYTFNRQRPALNYIADFMCKELKLIIEVDGYTHLLEDVIKNDIIRQQKFEQAGFTLIRFKDEEVLNEINKVREIILNTIQQLKLSL